MTIHQLKIAPEHFNPVNYGLKTAEVRLNDRDYSVGDYLILKEWDNGFTGRQVSRKVTHVADLGSFRHGYVLLSMI